jgi:hypothetical protein
VHSVDIKVADRYANDGVTTRLNEISKTEASQKLAGRIKSRVVSG